MNGEQMNEQPKSSSAMMVLMSILMLIIGGLVGYFITKTYYPTKETVTTTVTPKTATSTSVSASPSASAVDTSNWKTESEKVVTKYLNPGGVGIVEKLRTANLNGFVTCVRFSPANSPEGGHFINADIVLGVQNWPENPEVEIISSNLNNNQVIVKAKLKNSTFDTKTYDFYLIQEKNPVSGNNEWLINDTNTTKNLNPSDYNCSR